VRKTYWLGLGMLISQAVVGVSSVSAHRVAEDLRLGLGTDVVQYSELKIEEDGGAERESETLSIGLLDNVLFSVGYAFTERWVFDVDLGLNLVNHEQGGAELDITRLSLIPGVEYMLGLGDVRAFVGGDVGVTVHNQDDGSDETSSTVFLVGAKIGTHAFLSDTFSISPAAFFRYHTGSGTAELSQGGERDFDVSGFDVGVSATFSGWI